MDSKMKDTDYGTKKFSLSHEEYLRVTDASSGILTAEVIRTGMKPRGSALEDAVPRQLPIFCIIFIGNATLIAVQKTKHPFLYRWKKHGNTLLPAQTGLFPLLFSKKKLKRMQLPTMKPFNISPWMFPKAGSIVQR